MDMTQELRDASASLSAALIAGLPVTGGGNSFSTVFNVPAIGILSILIYLSATRPYR